MKRMVTLLLSVLLTFTLAIPALAGSLDSEIATATQFLQAKGILQGNASGDLQLEKPLTRAELAVIASRLTVNQEHLMADKSYYSGQCKFTDVPDWARVYVGYCASMYYVKGYSDGSYGPDGLVTPAAACTVLLRCCGNLVPFEWSYETALDAAVQYGIAPREALQEQYISRGNLSILLYRTAEKLGFNMEDVDTTPDTEPAPDNSGVSDLEQQVVDLVNQERAAYGLAPLTLNTELCNGARLKSPDMLDNGYFSHYSPTYGSPFEMMTTLGIDRWGAAENIARGQKTAEEVMNSWMNSPGHRANILSEEYSDIGVGYAGGYWTQWFIGTSEYHPN